MSRKRNQNEIVKGLIAKQKPAGDIASHPLTIKQQIDELDIVTVRLQDNYCFLSKVVNSVQDHALRAVDAQGEQLSTLSRTTKALKEEQSLNSSDLHTHAEELKTLNDRFEFQAEKNKALDKQLARQAKSIEKLDNNRVTLLHICVLLLASVALANLGYNAYINQSPRASTHYQSY